MSKKKTATSKAVAFIKGDERSYDERSDVAKRQSVGLLMDQGIVDFDSGVMEINDGARSFIRGCNKIREAGRKFEEAEKIGQFEFRNWHTDAESWKQDAIRREKIKAAQKVYRRMPGRAEKMEDCTPVIQAMFEIAGLMPHARRLGGETAHEPLNPFNAFISTAATVETWLRKLEPEDAPVEAYYACCGVETLQKIELATRPMAERHKIVARLLKEKEEA